MGVFNWKISFIPFHQPRIQVFTLHHVPYTTAHVLKCYPHTNPVQLKVTENNTIVCIWYIPRHADNMSEHTTESKQCNTEDLSGPDRDMFFSQREGAS